MSHHPLIIIGSGPAGLTAALYSARADLNPLIVDGIQPGGQLMITTDVENYPGFPEGVMGPDLMERFRSQAERFGASYHFGTVASVELSDDARVLHMDDGSSLSCDALILATGATARLLGLENESKLMGYGVSACATCDGAFFRDQKVVVVGGGDTAMEEASFLAKFASEVHIVHRRDELRASKPMQARVKNNEKCHFIWNSQVVDCLGEIAEGGLTGVILEDTETGARSTFDCNGLFLAIGHTPNTEFLGQWLEKDENGYLLNEPDSTRTKIAGVFACGDVIDHVYRQAITAAGTGCMAALDAERYLEA